MGNDRKVRKGQVITPFGPGGIFDFGDESFLALDISQWKPQAYRRIGDLPRLQNILGVLKLCEPRIASENKWESIDPFRSIPYMRFPAWLFCPKCRGMHKWTWREEKLGKPPACDYCGGKSRLAPMRFVSVCENGHISDIDWIRWAHFSAGTRCQRVDLEFVSDPSKGSGLASLSIRCRSCNSSQSLENIGSKDALKHKGMGRCSGRHPWEHHDSSKNCDRVPQVVQRGASNAYFPSTIAALDIQKGGVEITGGWRDLLETHQQYMFLTKLWELNPDKEDVTVKMLLDTISESIGTTNDDIVNYLKGEPVVEDRTGIEDGPQITDDLRLKADEWEVFNSAENIQSDVFSTERVDLESFFDKLPSSENPCSKELSGLLDRVVLARRIRIVRALRGFRRLDPAGPLLGANFATNRPEWLPAIEIFGEGIFVSLNQNKLEKWERLVGLTATRTMMERQEQSGLGKSLPEASARFVLLHTLSHLLIRQLCFECGYSSSSLAERIYCSDDMAGILIYTASGDSEGALGGLVREGEPERFYGILKTALYRGRWCSNDPICSELPFQGYGGMNKAACHACSLLGETSCETANSLLDRGLVFGRDQISGFFAKFVSAMENE